MIPPQVPTPFLVKPYREDIAIKNIPIDHSKKEQYNKELNELAKLKFLPYQKNLALAEAIGKEVRKHLLYGTNAEKDSRKSTLSFLKKVEIINNLREEVHSLVAVYRKSHLGNWPSHDQSYAMCYDVMKKIGFGHCGELTKAAFVEGQENPEIQALSYCSTSIGQHALLVIGEMDAEDAVVCDVWAEKYYPLHQLREMQNPEHDVKYAREFYQPENFWMFSNKSAPPSYLAGELTVQFSWHRGD